MPTSSGDLTQGASRKTTLLARVLFAAGCPWSLVNLYGCLYGCGAMVAVSNFSATQFYGVVVTILSMYGVLVWIRFGRIGYFPENLPSATRLGFWRNATVYHAIAVMTCAISPVIDFAITPWLIFALLHAIWLVFVVVGWRWERAARL